MNWLETQGTIEALIQAGRLVETAMGFTKPILNVDSTLKSLLVSHSTLHERIACSPTNRLIDLWWKMGLRLLYTTIKWVTLRSVHHPQCLPLSHLQTLLNLCVHLVACRHSFSRGIILWLKTQYKLKSRCIHHAATQYNWGLANQTCASQEAVRNTWRSLRRQNAFFFLQGKMKPYTSRQCKICHWDLKFMYDKRAGCWAGRRRGGREKVNSSCLSLLLSSNVTEPRFLAFCENENESCFGLKASLCIAWRCFKRLEYYKSSLMLVYFTMHIFM